MDRLLESEDVIIVSTCYRTAKEQRIRIWKDYVPKKMDFKQEERDFSGMVIQIVNADAVAVKSSTGVRTVHLSSVRPPRCAALIGGTSIVPWLFTRRNSLSQQTI